MAEEQTVVLGQQPIGVRQNLTPSASNLPTPPPRPPRRNPKLTRDDMIKVIREGGSVIHQGEMITHESQLPTEEDISRGDKDREETARQSLDDQIASLNRRRDALDAKPSKAPAADLAKPPVAPAK